MIIVFLGKKPTISTALNNPGGSQGLDGRGIPVARVDIIGGGSIITYDPLWETLRRKDISTYALITKYSFSRGTLDSLKQNRNISTATLNDLCNILSCKVEEVLVHIPDET